MYSDGLKHCPSLRNFAPRSLKIVRNRAHSGPQPKPSNARAMGCCSHRSQPSAPPSRKAFLTLTNPGNPASTEATNQAIPTAAQLADARLRRWHQQGEALLTIENLRSWLNTAGLVLFAPRPQIVAPAPSLVEAVLGAPNPSPTIEQAAEARSLLARLVAEGLAVPLNLLGAGTAAVHAGAPGDTPDFVVSTADFSYIFTLRGDKAWKQPPAAAGSFKLSPLARATFDALIQRGPSSASDLANEVGKEVTEAAVLRALAELWTHLRVLPIAQPDGTPTLWELASARFTKQIKAGANAGQPSALSALISLYLGQAIVASEDEIESFLSPLASRSRIRDVIHALLSARQLDTLAVQGRTVFYVAGEMPAFLAPHTASAAARSHSPSVAESAAVEGEAALIDALRATAEPDTSDGTQNGAASGQDSPDHAAPRIAKFIPKPRKIGTGYLAKAKPSHLAAKPLFKPGQKPRPGSEFKPRSSKGKFGPAFNARADAAPSSNRERRPFSKPPASRFDNPGGLNKTSAFDKPWNEEKARRRTAAAKPSQLPPENRQPSADRAAFPVSPSDTSSPRSRAPIHTGERNTGDSRPPRKSFSKSGTFARKRAGFATRPAFDGDARPPRRAASSGQPNRKPYAERSASDTPFSGKPRLAKDKFANKHRGSRDGSAGSEGTKRVYRKFDAPRNRPERAKSYGQPHEKGLDGPSKGPTQDAAPRNFADNKQTGFANRKPSARPGGFAGKKPFAKFSARPGASMAQKPFGKAAGKPGSFADKKHFAKSSGPGKPRASAAGKPASTFAKFAGNRKPFGNRPPARKFKPGKDRPA